MPDGKRLIPLNTAQLRSLRNWPKDQLKNFTITVVLRLEKPTADSVVRMAIDELSSRHEALHSRLVVDSKGRLAQEVSQIHRGQTDQLWETIDIDKEGSEESVLRESVQVSPYERAIRFISLKKDDKTTVLKLTVSHLFADVLGVQALARDLRTILDASAPGDLPRQASAYAKGPEHPRVRQNTVFWKQQLSGAPRACTYAPATRTEYERFYVARTAIEASRARAVRQTCRELHITISAFWAGIMSILASRFSGEHHQVLRTTCSNRRTRKDFDAVVQLAQVLYVPLIGCQDDTLRGRLTLAAKSLLPAFSRGNYDACELLDWLNHPARYSGACFRPAFELNYVPHVSDDVSNLQFGSHEIESIDAVIRTNPFAAKADLQLTVLNKSDPVLQIGIAHPVASQRSAARILNDCLDVADLVCGEPDTSIDTVSIPPFDATAELITGHHSKVAVHLGKTRELLQSCASVKSCKLEFSDPEYSGGRELCAEVTLSDRIDREELLRHIRERQPWVSGSVVPDEIIVIA
jgi:hypothetical protein